MYPTSNLLQHTLTSDHPCRLHELELYHAYGIWSACAHVALSLSCARAASERTRNGHATLIMY